MWQIRVEREFFLFSLCSIENTKDLFFCFVIISSQVKQAALSFWFENYKKKEKSLFSRSSFFFLQWNEGFSLKMLNNAALFNPRLMYLKIISHYTVVHVFIDINRFFGLLLTLTRQVVREVKRITHRIEPNLQCIANKWDPHETNFIIMHHHLCLKYPHSFSAVVCGWEKGRYFYNFSLFFSHTNIHSHSSYPPIGAFGCFLLSFSFRAEKFIRTRVDPAVKKGKRKKETEDCVTKNKNPGCTLRWYEVKRLNWWERNWFTILHSSNSFYYSLEVCISTCQIQ